MNADEKEIENYMLKASIEEKMPNPPVWEEYVPFKYQNPRPFPKKGKHIA